MDALEHICHDSGLSTMRDNVPSVGGGKGTFNSYPAHVQTNPGQGWLDPSPLQSSLWNCAPMWTLVGPTQVTQSHVALAMACVVASNNLHPSEPGVHHEPGPTSHVSLVLPALNC